LTVDPPTSLTERRLVIDGVAGMVIESSSIDPDREVVVGPSRYDMTCLGG
jgi:hypothetical protein